MSKPITKPTVAKLKPATLKKQTVILPKPTKEWRKYPLNLAPLVGNECGKLALFKYGGLTYI